MRVHRNLHNARHGGPQWVHTVKGLVNEYLEEVVLTGVTTRIQPAGQRKAKDTQVRNVCAYFDGDRGDASVIAGKTWHRVSYDPRKDTAFQADGARWNTADATVLAADGVTYVCGARWVA